MSLFDTSWSPASRASDPATSKQAEDIVTKLTRNKWMRLVLWAMVERERVGDDGTTASEAIMRLSYLGDAVPETGSIARRITDLAERDLIETVPAGDGTPLARPGASGKPQQVWRSTDTGRAELARAVAAVETDAA